MNQGFVIALDGPDGVGKTTQLDLLHAYLKSLDKDVHVTRASGGTPIGEALRDVSKSHHRRSAATDVFISLAMYTALADDLAQRRKHDEIILIDRSPLAMFAYNAFAGQLPETSSSQLIPTRQQVLEACVDSCQAWRIDLLLFLDAPQTVLDARLKERGGTDYFESQNPDYHHRVRQGYELGHRYLSKLADFRTKIVQIDASPDIKTIGQTITNTIDSVLTS